MSSVERLDEIIHDYQKNQSPNRRFSESLVRWLLVSVEKVFLSEPTILDLEPPIYVCGDIHGQFLDLLSAFQTGGNPPNSKYLFLGDYVDRGSRSLEVIILLFAMKLRYPNHIFLLRGNHESPEMTESFGFATDCETHLTHDIWETFLDVFNCLPLAANIGSKYFCIHGGLSPLIESLDDISSIQRPTPIPDQGIMADILWSDPSPYIQEWGPNPRGATISWGLEAVKEFLQKTGFSHIIRAHQMASEGYNYPFYPDQSVITIFTASHYADVYQNKAAMIEIKSDLTFKFHVLEEWAPLNLEKEVPKINTPRKKKRHC